MDKEKNARLAALSAAIPHISFAHQKKLAVMVKLMEINDICKYYDHAEAHGKTSQDPHWKQNLLNALMPHLNEKKQSSLKTMMQVMEMQDVLMNLENLKEVSEWK